MLKAPLKEINAEVGDLGEDVDVLEEVVENLDNSLRNIRGLKETMEGEDLVHYLVELFSEWARSECGLVINIQAAFRVGIYRAKQRYLRDRIVKLPHWNIKSKVLGA